MTTDVRRILVTGAAGFIGRALTAALLDAPMFATARIVLLDASLIDVCDPRAEAVRGDLSDPAVVETAIGDGVDLVYHLAAIVGGAAETDYALARRVNIDATLTLFERLRASGCPRVVYASTIGVFGEPPPPSVDDATAPRPTMVYGAQKRMIEIALAQFSTRGWLDGLSLRLPAVVAKPAVPGVEAVFLNRLFHAFASGDDVELPVSPEGTLWLLSTTACMRALLHAGTLPSNAIGDDRTLTLPALQVTVGRVIDALNRYYPQSPTQVTFKPIPMIEAQFAAQPPLFTPTADRFGFRHDGDIDQLIAFAAVRVRLNCSQ